MSLRFDARRGLIIIPAEVHGPAGSAVLRLALDTGATNTVINAAMLVAVGYDPALAPERMQVTTGSGVEYAPRVVVEKLTALQRDQTAFALLCHTLPPSAGVDGLLGLDFLRGTQLIIDFRAGRLVLD